MRDRNEVARAIEEILIPYVENIAWEDFGAYGNPCYDPNDFSSPAEEEEAAYTLAAVQLEMKKYGARHTDLAEKVAKQTKNKYVTYPWLRDAVSRILSGTTYDELFAMARLSRAVKDGMKAKGLTEINSIDDVL